MDKEIVILFGPPGAGKGTQADFLVDKYGLHHVETSKVIEAQFRSHDDDQTFEVGGKEFTYGFIREQWATGLLVEPEVVIYWLMEEIKRLNEEGKSLIFSASPRTLAEAKAEIPLLKELYGPEHIHAVLIDIPSEVTIYRNSHRRICEKCRTPLPYSDETKNLTECPKCGGPLMTRELDDPSVIVVRLKEYEERTLPIIEYMEEQNIVVHKVDGDRPIEEVAEGVAKELSL